MIKRSRGRPKKPLTPEREATDKWLRNMSVCPELLLDDSFTEEWFDHTETVRQQILSDYKHNSTVADKHAYDMASLGDQSMEGCEEGMLEILAEERSYRAKNKENCARGTLSNSQNSRENARLLYDRNLDLIERMESPNGLSLNSIATIIHQNWADRMVLDSPLSIRTITRQLNSEIKLRQASCLEK